jgi:hypothetical protein
MSDPWLEVPFQRRRRWDRRFPMVNKPQVVRSVTRRLSKASPGAYRSYRMINMTCFNYLCMC